MEVFGSVWSAVSGEYGDYHRDSGRGFSLLVALQNHHGLRDSRSGIQPQRIDIRGYEHIFGNDESDAYFGFFGRLAGAVQVMVFNLNSLICLVSRALDLMG